MRFSDVVGYAESTETSPGSGKWEDVITETTYSGDVVRNSRRAESGETLNDDLTVNNSISVVADKFLIEHFFNIKYVRWQGVRWKVDTVEVRPPRLILNIGGMYNGPTP